MGVRSWVRKVCRGDKHGKRLGSAVNLKKVFSAQVFARLPCDHKLSVELGSNLEFIESWGRPFLQPAYTSLTNTRHTFQKIFFFLLFSCLLSFLNIHCNMFTYSKTTTIHRWKMTRMAKKMEVGDFEGSRKSINISLPCWGKNIQEVSRNTIGKNGIR